MTVHAGKYGSLQIKNTDNTQTKHNSEKKQCKTQRNKTTLV